MRDILRGNFKTKREVKADNAGEKTLEERFEKEALKRLGGSIAFVSKKKVIWDMGSDAGEEPKQPKKK